MTRKYTILSWGLILTGIVATFVLYDRLPDPYPTHFGLDGTADRYEPLPWGAFILPTVSVFVWVLFQVLPKISPRGFRMDDFLDAYQVIVLTVIAFLTIVHLDMLWQASRGSVTIGRWMPIGIGALFCVIGNLLNKTTPNFFLGIRTPWTLADPEVWSRTHRVGGWAFMLIGITLILTSLFGSAATTLGIVLIASLGVAIGLVVYSYVLYRKLDKGV